MPGARVVALHLGSEGISRAVFARTGRRTVTLERCEHAAIQPEKPGFDAWLSAVAGAIASLDLRSNARARVVLTVPPSLVLTKVARTPKVPAAQQAAVAQFEATHAIPYPLDEVVWDSSTCGVHNEQEFVFFAVKLTPLRALIDVLARAGVIVDRAIPPSVALAQAFRFSHPRIAEEVLVVAVKERSTQLLLLHGERGRGRALSFGVDDFGVVDAPRPHEQCSAAGRGRVASAADATDGSGNPTHVFADRLGFEVSRTLAAFAWASAKPAPVAVYFTATSRTTEIRCVLEQTLQVPVHDFDAWRDIRFPLETDNEATRKDAELVGIAAELLGPATTVNLLPPELRRIGEFRGRQRTLLAAAVLLCLGLFAPTYVYVQRARAAARDAARLEERLVPVRALYQDRAAALARLHAAAAQLVLAGEVGRAQTDWVCFLAHLQATLTAVEDAWLDDLQLVPLMGGSANEPEPHPGEARPLEVVLRGRLLDPHWANARARVSTAARVEQLIQGITSHAAVASAGEPRFDDSEPGSLRFELPIALKLHASGASSRVP